MAQTIFAEKDFSRILNNVNGYGIVILDRIRESNGTILYMIIQNMMHIIALLLSQNFTHI